ncbi:MAG: hypothetical protein KGJ78_15370, partial [Alphaproteobacteria bacterium]|nr:hypothetical protein [Alphaproteobacteria bacterium]
MSGHIGVSTPDRRSVTAYHYHRSCLTFFAAQTASNGCNECPILVPLLSSTSDGDRSVAAILSRSAPENGHTPVRHHPGHQEGRHDEESLRAAGCVACECPDHKKLGTTKAHRQAPARVATREKPLTMKIVCLRQNSPICPLEVLFWLPISL